MIYICADDYGLCGETSAHIQRCIDESALDKVSIFPNFGDVNLQQLLKNEDLRVSLHLNLVEGKCMSNAEDIGLIADKSGNFKNTFAGLLKLDLFNGKKLEEETYKEIRAQVLFWKKILPEGAPFCIDSHQHTHMIPSVFRALLKVLDEENIDINHMRIPAEPLLPFVTTPSLYFTYNPINIIKQWLLKFLWQVDKKYAKKHKIPTSYFFGILFSGRMDEKRVNKILPKYVSAAEKNSMDIEILFHPGYLKNADKDFKNNNIVFEKFYLSQNRKTEYDSVLKISERSV